MSEKEQAAESGRTIKCAFCDSADVELFSLFGQTLLGSQYYCNNCRSVFEAVRFDDEDGAASAASSNERNANGI